MRSKETSREVRSGFSEDRPCIAKEYNFDFHLDSAPDHPLTGPIPISISVPDLPLRGQIPINLQSIISPLHTHT